MINLKAAGALLALSFALPVLAQTTPPPPAGMAAGPDVRSPGGKHGWRGARHGAMFASMSPAGQQIMRDAMRPADMKTDHQAMKASRDRVLAVLDADKLDSVALKRAVEDERKAAEAMHSKRQAVMMEAYAKLSTADRKAFVADARAMRARMETRMKAWRDGGGKKGAMDMPSPPPM